MTEPKESVHHGDLHHGVTCINGIHQSGDSIGYISYSRGHFYQLVGLHYFLEVSRCVIQS